MAQGNNLYVFYFITDNVDSFKKRCKYANLYCTDNPPNDEWSSVASHYGKTDILCI